MDILRTTRLTSEKWLNLFVRVYRHKGQERQWVFASRKPDPPVPARGFDAVVIVPILLNPGAPPRLVITKEFRVPLGNFEYGFPAGLAEEGESIEEVARRELREETGLEVVEIKKVSPPTYSSPGMTDESAVIVFVTAQTAANGGQSLDDSEDIEVLFMDYEQVCKLCNSNARMNGRTWTILYMFQQMGKLT
jgi:ADP-ribose pyrophosphatase